MIGANSIQSRDVGRSWSRIVAIPTFGREIHCQSFLTQLARGSSLSAAKAVLQASRASVPRAGALLSDIFMFWMISGNLISRPTPGANYCHAVTLTPLVYARLFII